MAYTRPWAEVMNLAGARDADEIDDNDREEHTDFTERLTDILYDVAADPWVVRVPGVQIDGKVSYAIPAPSAVVTAGVPIRNDFDIQPSVAGAPGILGVIFPVQAPAGSTFVLFEIKGYRTNGGASVVARLIEVDSAAETATPVGTASLDLVQVGIQTKSSGLLNLPMPFNKSYYVSVVLTPHSSGAATARLSSIYITTKLAGTP